MLVKEARQMTMDVLGRFSPSGAREFASAVVRGEGREQVTKAAHDVLEWSNRTRERVTELVRAEVRAQLKQVGVASRDEVDALRRRVRELEKAARQAPPRRSSTRRTSGDRTSAASPTAG
jgi:polyhydroxyalkanoate synthesis regulator phasin